MANLRFPQSSSRVRDSWLSAVPLSTFDTSVDSAREAKRRREFWVSSSKQDFGVGMRVLDDQGAFQGYFPGYPEAMRTDRGLWARYFRLPFTTATYSRYANFAKGEGRLAYLSSLGCIEIAERYGADILIFGNSETNQAINPDTLGAGNTQRVLSCAAAGQTIYSVERLAGRLKSGFKGKAKAVIWGFSPWWLYRDSEVIRNDEKVQREEYLNAFGPHLVPDWMNLRLSDFFPSISWSNFLHASLNELQAKRAAESDGHGENSRVYSADPAAGGFYFSRDDLTNGAAIEILASKTPPYYQALAGSRDTGCGFERAEAEIKQVVEQLSEVGEKVFIYVPPTTSLMVAAMPACLIHRVTEILQGLAGPHVKVKIENAESYGLSWTDYAVPDYQREGRAFLDINHVNAEGARKVTSRIAAWVQTESRRTP